jgi:hypothetical protein
MKRFFLMCLVLGLLLPLTLSGQAVTTAEFSGLVVDNEGTPLPGVEIKAVHEPTGTTYTSITRGNGRFNLPGLRVGGPYTVSASLQSFRTEEKEDLVLKLGENKELKFMLQLETIDAGEIVVTATDPIINPSRTGASQNVAQEAIENLPTISRSLSDFTRLAPQMVADDETDGSFTSGGRSPRYNNVQIDGAQNNDLFGLGSTGTPGGQAETTPISLEAVQEFQVVLAPYDVRQGMFTGGGVNIITRSGANDFHGSAYFEGWNESFVGNGPDDYEFAKFTEKTYGLSFGGPIIKNKLFFFVSGEVSKKSVPEDYYIDGSGASYDWGHKAEADRFVQLLQGYGYDSGGYDAITNDRTSNKLFARLDWNISDKHKLTLRHNFVDADYENLYRDSQYSFTFGNGGVVYLNKTNSTVLQLNSSFSKDVYNELILNYQTIRDNPTYMGEAFPRIIVSIPGASLYAGSEEYRHRNELNQDLFELTNSLTLFKGDHTIILGTHNEFFKFYNVYIQREFGKYEFSSLDDFELGKVYRYDRYYSLTGDPNAPAEFSVYQLGLYAGDDWLVSPNFKLTLGLRMDVPLMPDDPPANALVEAKFGIPTDHNAGGNILWSPRVGFNWDVKGDASSQLRGGVGIFSGRTPYVWISNQYSNTGTDLARYRVYYPDFFVTDPSNQPTNPSPYATGDINLIDESYKFPQVFKTNIAIDQKLPWGFVGTLEFVYSRSINEILYQNINIAPNGQFSAFDGRPLFGTPSTSGSAAYGSPDYVHPEFENVLLLSNTSEGYQYNLTFQLQKEWRDGSMINAAYTYGMSKDLYGGTSSRAISNWGYNITEWDPNNPKLSYSPHDTRHRFMFAFTRKLNIFKGAPTFFSLFYNGRSGHPYSTRYYNDVNGDSRQNDSIWVPANESDIILTKGTWAELDAYISADPALDAHRGQILPRNASRDPWYHGIDIKLAQDIPMPFLKGHRLQVYVTLKNLLNLFNSEWGVYRYILYDDAPLTFVGYDQATGKPMFEFWGKTADKDARYVTNQILSRWRMLLGVKYRF